MVNIHRSSESAGPAHSHPPSQHIGNNVETAGSRHPQRKHDQLRQWETTNITAGTPPIEYSSRKLWRRIYSPLLPRFSQQSKHNVKLETRETRLCIVFYTV